MGKTEVPITPEVLDWAIAESGFSLAEVAEAADVEEAELRAWLTRQGRPGVTAVRALAQALKRPVAIFLLPTPPAAERPDVRFRHTPGVSGRALSPAERRYLRKAARLQRMAAWLKAELREAAPRLPAARLEDDAEASAQRARNLLGVTVEEQLEWTSPSAAFDAWRAAVENLGVAVFLFQLGRD